MTHKSLTTWGLTDPDLVGSTEYRAIYDALADALDDYDAIAGELEPATEREHLLAMLDEFIASATYMKAQLEKGTSNGTD